VSQRDRVVEDEATPVSLMPRSAHRARLETRTVALQLTDFS